MQRQCLIIIVNEHCVDQSQCIKQAVLMLPCKRFAFQSFDSHYNKDLEILWQVLACVYPPSTQHHHHTWWNVPSLPSSFLHTPSNTKAREFQRPGKQGDIYPEPGVGVHITLERQVKGSLLSIQVVQETIDNDSGVCSGVCSTTANSSCAQIIFNMIHMLCSYHCYATPSQVGRKWGEIEDLNRQLSNSLLQGQSLSSNQYYTCSKLYEVKIPHTRQLPLPKGM